MGEHEEFKVKKTERIDQERGGNQLIGQRVLYNDGTELVFFAVFPIEKLALDEVKGLGERMKALNYPAIFTPTAGRALDHITTGIARYFVYDAVSDTDCSIDPLIAEFPTLAANVCIFADGSRFIFGTNIPTPLDSSYDDEIDLAIDGNGAAEGCSEIWRKLESALKFEAFKIDGM